MAELRLVELTYENGKKKYQVEKEESPNVWVPIENAPPFWDKEIGLKVLKRERAIENARSICKRKVIA